jgi:acyl-coenzyme A synthetase/AMP-(fatty) acid ligase
LSYRTGDRVRRPEGDAPMTYLGRSDFQVKISGHRVELGEIEAVLREETGRDHAVVIGWPKTDTGYAAVVAVVGGTPLDVDAIRASVAKRLPPYMVPREIRFQAEMPLNSNGKVDRNALAAMFEEKA